jgi:hypothetical protein
MLMPASLVYAKTDTVFQEIGIFVAKISYTVMSAPSCACMLAALFCQKEEHRRDLKES